MKVYLVWMRCYYEDGDHKDTLLNVWSTRKAADTDAWEIASIPDEGGQYKSKRLCVEELEVYE